MYHLAMCFAEHDLAENRICHMFCTLIKTDTMMVGVNPKPYNKHDDREHNNKVGTKKHMQNMNTT